MLGKPATCTLSKSRAMSLFYKKNFKKIVLFKHVIKNNYLNLYYLENYCSCKNLQFFVNNISNIPFLLGSLYTSLSLLIIKFIETIVIKMFFWWYMQDMKVAILQKNTQFALAVFFKILQWSLPSQTACFIEESVWLKKQQHRLQWE